MAPGLIVHVPVAGKPFNTTLPVDIAQEEGCVIVLTIGAVGATGAACITTLADGCDIHPAAAVMLKL
jgi:riboflavin synthase